MIAVEVENLSKRFRRQTVQPYTTIKSALVDVLRRRRRSAEADTFEVLRGITFSVQQGQTLSMIGRNLSRRPRSDSCAWPDWCAVGSRYWLPS